MENLPPSNQFENSNEGRAFVFTKARPSLVYMLGLIVFLSLFYFIFLSAPGDFPIGTVVRIEPGMSLRSISAVLKKQHIIKSRTVFESLVIILGGERHIVSADYLFEDKLSVWQIALRIERGEHNMAPVSVTIPEGFDSSQIGDVLASKLTNFDKNQFLQKAKNLEGYLFPDTYFFFTNTDEEEVIDHMHANYQKKIKSFLPEIASANKTEKDIIIMASLIEGEAKGDADREIISGILWKRIQIGMPLQVDSAPETYRTKGLPKSPIGNPGLKAINASIHPQNSPFLYYLHDKKGNIHYAKTFAEHVKNKLKYL